MEEESEEAATYRTGEEQKDHEESHRSQKLWTDWSINAFNFYIIISTHWIHLLYTINSERKKK